MMKLTASEHRKRAQLVWDKHLGHLMLAQLLSMVLGTFVGALLQMVTMDTGLPALAQVCVTMMLHYGLIIIFTRCFRGQDYWLYQLFPWNMVFKCLGLFIVRAFIIAIPIVILVPIVVNYPEVRSVLMPMYIVYAVYFCFIACTYCMCEYLWVDHPETGIIRVMRESRRRMKGRRWALVKLFLSYTGWFVLSYAVVVVIHLLIGNILVLQGILLYLLIFIVFSPSIVYLLLGEISFFESTMEPDEAEKEFDLPDAQQLNE